MRYDLVLLDADGTLFDFDAASKAAFGASCRRLMPELGDEALDPLYAHYHHINAAIWLELERGEIDKDSLKVERFRRLIEGPAEPREPLAKLDPAVFGRVYLEALAREAILLPGALAFVQSLAERGCRPAIATNGIASVQRGRFAASPLGTYVGELLISEELGAEKPSRAFFEAALERTASGHRAGLEKGRVAMIGDSWSADIEGALDFGIEAIWYNPARKTAPRPDAGAVDAGSYAEVLAALETGGR